MAQHETSDCRTAVDAKLTELMLYAKELCPSAVVDISSLRYEDEDGHVEVFPPPSLSDIEVDRMELMLASRSAEIFDQTGLYIVCAVLDPNPSIGVRSTWIGCGPHSVFHHEICQENNGHNNGPRLAGAIDTFRRESSRGS